jgi:PIF1 helicase.
MGKTVIGNELAMEAIMRGDNVFVTGPGGCGKSLMIASLREFFADSFLFVAPTGIAALNIGGITTHKAFGLTFGVTTKEDFKAKSKKPAMLMASDALDALVFDEISMTRSDKLREIDMKLRYHRKVNKPFGGLQVIAFGDGFQIKPVLKREETAMFRELHGNEIPFGSDIWNELNFTNAYLPKVHRQADPVFAGHLNNIRVGKNIGAAVDYFNQNCFGPPLAGAVTLTTTNKLAEEINDKEFHKIKAEPREFKAQIKGEFTERPVNEILNLKVGLKVMIVVNDNDEKKKAPDYVNGTVGIITKIAHSYCTVDIDGRQIAIGKNEWTNVVQVPEEKLVQVEKEIDMPDGTKQVTKVMEKQMVLVDKEIGKYLQFPFKLGYAITGHKAQGLTLGKVNIDLGYGTFTPGQAYVMLSRATSPEGLRLMKRLRVKDIIVDQGVKRFYEYTFPEIFGGQP